MLGFNGGRIGIANTVFTGTKSDDPNYSNVSLLLNGNGTNGSTTFTDSSSYGHTVTANGNAQISTTQSKFGGASMYFDGSGDYLTLPASAEFLFPGDHTIECWIHWDGTYFNTGRNIYGTGGSASLDQFGIFSSTGLLWGAVYNNVSSNYPPINQWAHVAASRQGSTIRLFINGVLTASGTQSASIGSSTGNAYVGNRADLSHPFKGYIDDLRITKGVARYTSNFTPPTAQLPGGGTGTIASGVWTLSDHIKQIRNELWPGLVTSIVTDGLVLHLDAGNTASYPGTGNTWFDLTTNSNDGTITGATYDSADGGSLSFDGNDYVSCGNPSPLQITQGTISAWVKTSSPGSAYRGIIAKPNNYGLFAKDGILVAYDWGNSAERTTSINIADGNWKNVVMSFTENTGTPSNNALIYLNGSSVLTTTIKFVNNSINFEIGSGVGGQYINGNIAQVTIYNRPLTPSEVTQNFDALKGRYGL